MFDKIKAWFRKKPEEHKESILESDIPLWIAGREESILIKVKEALKLNNNLLLEKANSAKEMVVILAEKELQNPNIPEREKHFMEGNRETYLKRTNVFLQNLQLLETLGRADEYFANYEDNINQFHETTNRPFHILKQFFDHEVSAVSAQIREIDALIRKNQSLIKKEDYHKIQDIKKAWEEYTAVKERHALIEKRKEEEQEKEKSILLEKRRKEDELAVLRGSNEYQHVLTLKDEIQKIAEDLKIKKSEIHGLFSLFEQGLKKYARINYSYEALILKYLEDPVKSLMDDRPFRICLVLQNMKLAIQKDEIPLKPEKKEKMIEQCDRAGRDYFAAWTAQVKDLKEREQNLMNKIKEMPVMHDITRVKHEISLLESPLQEINESRAKLGRENFLIALQQREENLAQAMTELEGKPIEVKVIEEKNNKQEEEA